MVNWLQVDNFPRMTTVLPSLLRLANQSSLAHLPSHPNVTYSCQISLTWHDFVPGYCCSTSISTAMTMATDQPSFRRSLYAFAILVLSPTRAAILSTPTPTSTFDLQYLGVQDASPPQPTHHRRAPELLARQQVTLATCGYINGASSLPVTCNSGLYCATTSTFVGCCEAANCRNIFTSCYDLLGDTCDQACQNNPQNLLCSSTVPYCAHYLYEGGSLGLGCALIRGYTSTVYLSTLPPYSTLTTSTTNSTSQTSTSTASSASSSTSAVGGGGLSTGATAGIAVGATLAGVGLCLLAWFLVRRRKKYTKAPATEPTQDVNKMETSQPNNRNSHLSELGVKSPAATPQTPYFPAAAQPSPGFNGPPQYSQHYDGVPAEMPDNTRPISYAPTELSSTK